MSLTDDFLWFQVGNGISHLSFDSLFTSASDRQMSAGFGAQHQLFSPYAQAYLSSGFSASNDPFRPQKLKRSRQRVDAGEPRNSYSAIPNYTSGRASMTEPVSQPLSELSPSECSGKSSRPAKAASTSPPASLQQLYADAAERAGLLPTFHQRLCGQPTFFGISDILSSSGGSEAEKLSPAEVKVEPRQEGDSPDSAGGRKRKQSQPEKLAATETDEQDDSQSVPQSPVATEESGADRMQSEMFGLQQRYVQLLARRQQDAKAAGQQDAKELSDLAQRVKAELAASLTATVDRIFADYLKAVEAARQAPPNGNRPLWGPLGPFGPAAFPHPFAFATQPSPATIFPPFGPFGHLQPQFNQQSRATDEAAVSLVMPKKKRSKVTDTRVARLKPDESGSEASPAAYVPPTMVPTANGSSFLADDIDSLSAADSDEIQSEFGTFDSAQR